MSHPYMQPAHEPVRSLIYSASERAIRHVYVDGTQVVKDGKVLTVDVEAATAGLIEGQRKRLETVEPARLGRPRRPTAWRRRSNQDAGAPAPVARRLSRPLDPAPSPQGCPAVVEYSKCSGVSGWTSA